jgi:hypothetical protein
LTDDVEPEDTGLAGVGVEERCQDADGCGLAGAVGAEEPQDGALRDFEIDAVESDDVTEPLDDSLDDDGVVGTHELT